MQNKVCCDVDVTSHGGREGVLRTYVYMLQRLLIFLCPIYLLVAVPEHDCDAGVVCLGVQCTCVCVCVCVYLYASLIIVIINKQG